MPIQLTNDGILLDTNVNFGNVMRLRAEGERLIASHQQFQVHVDFAQMKFSDSSFLPLLLAWWRCAKKHQKILYFQNIPDAFGPIADITGLSKILQ